MSAGFQGANYQPRSTSWLRNPVLERIEFTVVARKKDDNGLTVPLQQIVEGTIWVTQGEGIEINAHYIDEPEIPMGYISLDELFITLARAGFYDIQIHQERAYWDHG